MTDHMRPSSSLPRAGDSGGGRTAVETTDRVAEYERRVEQMAAALHQDCILEWQAIAVVDPGRLVTQHFADAHYGKAHDLVRRIWPALA